VKCNLRIKPLKVKGKGETLKYIRYLLDIDEKRGEEEVEEEEEET
jgi:hypothetical protein